MAEITDVLLQQMEKLQDHVVRIADTVGDMKADLATVRTTGEATLEQTQRTNGRVTVAEGDIADLKRDMSHVHAFMNRDRQAHDQADADQRSRREGVWLIGAAVIGAGLTEFLHALGVG